MAAAPSTGAAAHALLQATVRRDWARMLAPLIGAFGDVGRAEDALQDAMIAALERWPTDGLPREPRAWLITTARRRAIDGLRREQRRPQFERESAWIAVQRADSLDAEPTSGPPPLLGTTTPAMTFSPTPEPGPTHGPDDDVLRLVFLCCHPALAPSTQTALSLRLLGGLTTPEIARAYLVPVATMSKRLARAKQKIARAAVPFVVPEPDELPSRVAAVARTLYLMFNEGYAASEGEELVREDLVDEAVRLGELVLELLPGEPQVLGVQALMLIQDARRATRIDPSGALVLLRDQDRSRWDAAKVRRGVELLGEGLARTPDHPEPYVVQAAIAACHALAPRYADTDWTAILSWYDVLLTVQDTPVVRLNRAAALAEAASPAEGLAAMEAIDGLGDYPWWFAARAELATRLGHPAQAVALLDRALALPLSSHVRAQLTLRRAAVLRA